MEQNNPIGYALLRKKEIRRLMALMDGGNKEAYHELKVLLIECVATMPPKVAASFAFLTEQFIDINIKAMKEMN